MNKRLPLKKDKDTLPLTSFFSEGTEEDYPASFKQNFDTNEIPQNCKIERIEDHPIDIEAFFDELDSKQYQLPPKIAKILNDNFWDL